MSPIKLFDENKSLAGLNLRHLLFQHGRGDTVRRAVDRVFSLWAEGKVKPLVDSTWALEDVSMGCVWVWMNVCAMLGMIVSELVLK